MATIFREVDTNTEAVIFEVLDKYHEPLTKEGVTVGALFAERITKHHETVPALKERGIDIECKVQVTSLQDRARGLPDAKLLFDHFHYDRMSLSRRTALIDYALEHLALVMIRPTKKNGYQSGVKRDDRNRPCLRVRPYQWQIRGFEKTASRHGEASVEAHQFRAFQESYGQLLMFDPAKFTKALVDRETFSKACKRRHHASCKGNGCGCACHKIPASADRDPAVVAAQEQMEAGE